MRHKIYMEHKYSNAWMSIWNSLSFQLVKQWSMFFNILCPKWGMAHSQVNENSLCANRQRVEHLCQKIPLFAKFQRNTEMLGRKLPSRHMGNQDLLHQLILPQLTTTSYPLKYAGVRGANPHLVKNPCITCDSPKT